MFKKEKVNLFGTVFSKRYIPPRLFRGSELYFSIDTKVGRKAIKVLGFGKENLEVLIEKGTDVEIKNIPKKKLNDKAYVLFGYRIEVIVDKQ